MIKRVIQRLKELSIMDYISMNNISMDTVRTYTELMLTRRGYTIGDFMDTDEEGIPGKKPSRSNQT